MEKLKKNLFKDKGLENNHKAYAGWCYTSTAGVTRCSSGLVDPGF